MKARKDLLLSHMAGDGGSHFTCLGWIIFSPIDSLQFSAHKDKRNVLPSDFSKHGLQNSVGMTRADRGHSWDMVSTVVPIIFLLLLALPRRTKNSFLLPVCKEEPFLLHHHLPSAIKPTAAPMCCKSAFGDLPSPFMSPILDREDARSNSRLV